MAGPASSQRRGLNSWLVIALLAVPFALFVGFLLSQGHSPASIEQRFSTRPDLAATLTAFRNAYPADYAAFLEQAAATADARGTAEAEREAIAGIRAFLAGRAGAIASAPAADLQALGRSLAGLAVQLQRFNPELCAQFVARGAMDPARLPDQIQRQIGEINARMFGAARAGEGQGAIPRGALSREEAALWVAQMARIDPTLAGQFANPAASETPAQICARGVTLYRAAAELPEAQSANVTAHLVRLSFERPAPAS